MFKKYNDLIEYKNDLRECIEMITECMEVCEKKITEYLGNNSIDTVYFSCPTSAGLASLLRKLDIDSQVLAFRLRYTNGLIKSSNIGYEGYRNTVEGLLIGLMREISESIENCNKNISRISKFDVKEYVMSVYLYIVKNIFMETFLNECRNKEKTENIFKTTIVV